MRKILALIFVMLVCVGVFAGCGEDGGETASNSSVAGPVADDGIFSIENVTYLDGDVSVYTVVRPDVAEESINQIGIDLYKAVRNGLGVSSVRNQTDSADGTDKYEILVGETNRPESAEAKKYLISSTGGRFQDFIIATIGKKIVICGITEEALKNACDYFVANFLKKEGVAGGIKYIGATQGDYKEATINGVKLGVFKIVKQRFNESYMTQLEIEKAQADLVKVTGYKPLIVEDHNAATDYEIIVGDAKRDGVAKVSNRDEYVIKIAGNKVYLNGGSPAAKALAVTEFSKMLQAGVVTDASSVTGSYSKVVAGYDATNYYKMTWGDDFDGVADGINGIDTKLWRVLDVGEDSAQGHNNRTSVRSKDILSVQDGVLHAIPYYDENYYYGFKLKTDSTMTYRFGILEMSAILPHGDGFWISLWANSYEPESTATYMTEINVVEMFGNSKSEASNCHGWLKGGQREVYETLWKPQGYEDHWSLDGKYSNQKRYECPEGNFNDGFHTFTYIWDENQNTFACDGNVYFSVDTNEDPVYKDTLNQRLHLILSEAVCYATGSGRNMDDNDPAWADSSDFQIDYVHIYQKDDGKHELVYNPKG